jgi:phosphomannomutase
VPSGPGGGTVSNRELLSEYAAYLRKLVDLSASRRLRVVVDAGNGMGGHTVPAVFEPLPFDVVPMYFELDGTFPNHEANPLDPANLVDLQKRVVARVPTSASPSTATPTAAS